MKKNLFAIRLFLAVIMCGFLFALLSIEALAAPKVMYDGGIFDPQYYADTNPDVKAVYGYNEYLLYMHYKNFGRNEGRLPYDPSAQPAAPAAIVTAPVVNTAPVQVSYGLSADPSQVKGFDASYYAANNPDVVMIMGNDPAVLYRHYLNYGMKEGRKANASGSNVGNLPLKQVNDKVAQIQAKKAAENTAAAQDAANEAVAAGSQPSSYSRETYPQAAAVLDAVGWNLQAAYTWSSHLTYYGHGKPDMPENGSPGTKWFAEFGFNNLKGNCYVMAATFTEMARLLGYDAIQISGQVPSRKGGLTPHSWVEIRISGLTYVFDPDYAYNVGGNAGFQIQYGQKGTWRYSNYAPMGE
ncbi:MAG: transglutaminase-like domain-containing protein [Lachnospiraceae bacterium]|nr:transglutaminase-like domain-containing protein [Lachnospiraceae bacterium]